MPLKSIVVESFNCNSKPCARFDWSSSVLLNPSFEHTTKATLTKETLWSKVPRCGLEIIESEFPQLWGNFELPGLFWGRWVTFRITSSRSCRWNNRSNWLVSAAVICRFTFCCSMYKTNTFEWLIIRLGYIARNQTIQFSTLKSASTRLLVGRPHNL